MTLLSAPLRPLADVLDLTAEALAAVGTVSVTALSLILDREHPEHEEVPRLAVVAPSN